jgi:hypothetical protein
MAEYFFENGITPPQNVSSALLSDITYINDLKGFGFGGGRESIAGGFLPKENWDQDKSIDTYVKHRAISFFEAYRGGVS